MGLKHILIASILLIPGFTAQEPDPSALGDLLRPIQDTLADAAVPLLEQVSGEDLVNEEVHLQAHVDAGNVEYQVVGILFGGGKVQADMQGDVTFAFHAIHVERIDRALQRSADNDNISLNSTFGFPSSRMVITAEEVRLLGAGIVLSAFQRQQEELATQFIQELLPGLRILGVTVDWANTQPATLTPGGSQGNESESPSRLRDPPLLLHLHAELQFLERVSLYQATQQEAKPERDSLRAQIKENQTLPFMKRDAFQAFGFNQLIAPNIPPGWTLELGFGVPQGFTIEWVTDAFERSSDGREVSFYVDGSDDGGVETNAGIVTFGNRLLVTSIMFTATLVGAIVLRTFFELAVFRQGRFDPLHRAAVRPDRPRSEKTPSYAWPLLRRR